MQLEKGKDPLRPLTPAASRFGDVVKGVIYKNRQENALAKARAGKHPWIMGSVGLTAGLVTPGIIKAHTGYTLTPKQIEAAEKKKEKADERKAEAQEQGGVAKRSLPDASPYASSWLQVSSV